MNTPESYPIATVLPLLSHPLLLVFFQTMPDASSRQPLSFGFWVPSISGGLVASKIPSTTGWSPEYNRKLAQTAEEVGFEWALTQIRFMAGYGAEYQFESVVSLERAPSQALSHRLTLSPEFPDFHPTFA